MNITDEKNDSKDSKVNKGDNNTFVFIIANEGRKPIDPRTICGRATCDIKPGETGTIESYL